jgi:hypothetical protein
MAAGRRRDRGRRFAYVKDPEGNLLELIDAGGGGRRP